MRVPPTSPTNLAERHVQFSEFVNVSVHSMTDTQMSTIVEPSVHGRRMEHILRTAEIVAAPSVPAAPEVPAVPRCTSAYKRTCDVASLLCGAATLPSVALVLLGPVWLVAPAVLFVASVTFYFMRGAPTAQMEQEYALRRAFIRAHDSEGV